VKRFARPYAEVLLETASAEGLEDVVSVELDALTKELGKSPELQRFLEDPIVEHLEKERVIERISETIGFHDLTRRLLFLLARNGRLGAIDDVLAGYRELLDRRQGIVAAEVAAAIPLDPERETRLRDALERVTGMKVRLAIRVDPALFAGFVAKVGSTVYDASLRGELQRIRRRLGGPRGLAVSSPPSEGSVG